MQVQAVNSQNNQQSFCAIYNVSKVNFTPKQNEVIDDIIKTLRKPMLRFRNKTSENYYKLKKNIDFSIDNCNRYEDSVYLEGWYNTTKTKDELIYEKPFLIGVYSPDKKFSVGDIKRGLKGDNGIPFIHWIIAPVIIIAGLFGVRAFDKSRPSNPKSLIENRSGEIFNNSKSDTVKIATKVLKVIKK